MRPITILLFLIGLGCSGLPSAPVVAPAPTPAAAPAPAPHKTIVAPPAPAPVATPVASDGTPLPPGGCEYDGVIYDDHGIVYGCIGGGNGCKNASPHACNGSTAAHNSNPNSCCCELLPTDASKDFTYQRLSPAVCAKGGPKRLYDGGRCVADSRCP